MLQLEALTRREFLRNAGFAAGAFVAERLIPNATAAEEAVSEKTADLGEWKRLTDPPINIQFPKVGVINDKLYVAGAFLSTPVGTYPIGPTVSHILSYEPKTDSWSVVTRMIDNLSAQDAGVIDHKLSEPKTDSWSAALRKMDNRSAQVVGVIDQESSVLIDDIYPSGLGVIDDKLFLISLFYKEERSERNPFPDEYTRVHIYDPKLDSWSRKSVGPLFRDDSSVVVLDEKFYILGGWTGHGFGKLLAPTVDVYDPKRDEWSQVADMIHGSDYPMPILDMNNKIINPNYSTPIGKGSMAVSVMDNKIYVIGGMVYQIQYWIHAGERKHLRTSNVIFYDPMKDSWGNINPLKIARYGHGSGVIQNKLYVVGGRGRDTPILSAEVYDPRTDEWQFLPDMLAPQRRCAVGVINNKLYSVGEKTLLVFKPKLDK